MSLNEALERYEEGGKLSAAQAGYMELCEAKKDANCRIVYVKGGISKDRGCCNFFEPEAADTKQFKCGNCEHLGKK